MTETLEQEQVVMTPKGKTANSTTLIIERRAVKQANGNMHVAGGEHTGIVINKEVAVGTLKYRPLNKLTKRKKLEIFQKTATINLQHYR